MRVKLCGLRDAHDVAAAIDAGADALGFVLAPSPRQVDVGHLAVLLRAVPAGIETFAVFRLPDVALVRRALDAGVHAVQGWAEGEAALPPGTSFLAVFRDGPAAVHTVGLFRRTSTVAPRIGSVLFDAAAGGGTGEAVDEARACAVSRAVAMVLAGGLTPDNVAARCAAVSPVAVDVSSGIEIDGLKDPGKMRRFVRAARGEDR